MENNVDEYKNAHKEDFIIEDHEFSDDDKEKNKNDKKFEVFDEVDEIKEVDDMVLENKSKEVVEKSKEKVIKFQEKSEIKKEIKKEEKSEIKKEIKREEMREERKEIPESSSKKINPVEIINKNVFGDSKIEETNVKDNNKHELKKSIEINVKKKNEPTKIITTKPIEEKTLYKINAKISDGTKKELPGIEYNDSKNEKEEIKVKEKEKINIDIEVKEKKQVSPNKKVQSSKQLSTTQKELNFTDTNDPRYPIFEKLITKPVLTLSVEELQMMVTRPLIKGTHLICNILRRKNSSLSGSIYSVYLDKNERFLMAARKKSNTLSPAYIITIDPDDFEKTKNYVGKVKSNILGTMFDIWDSGKKVTKVDKHASFLAHSFQTY